MQEMLNLKYWYLSNSCKFFSSFEVKLIPRHIRNTKGKFGSTITLIDALLKSTLPILVLVKRTLTIFDSMNIDTYN